MKKAKRIAAVVAASMMCMSCIGFGNISVVHFNNSAITANAVTTVWDGTVDTSWYDGEEAEMHISTAEEFAGFAKLIAGGTTMEGQTIILDKDVYLNDLSEIDTESQTAPTNVWSASDGTFNGTFDGKNHTVYGLYTTSIGLFDTIDENAVVQNINIDKSIARQNNMFGMICVRNFGTITGCNVTATISPKSNRAFGMIAAVNQSLIENCTTDGLIALTLTDVNTDGFGGICAISLGSIKKCTNNTEIKIETKQGISYGIGGIAGRASGIVSDCVNNADIIINNEIGCQVGGIIGEATAITVSNCVNNGKVITTFEDEDNHFGGIVGGSQSYSILFYEEVRKPDGGYYNGYYEPQEEKTIINKCINNGAIQSQNGAAGGIIAWARTPVNIITQCGNNGEVSGNLSGGIAGCFYRTSQEREASQVQIQYVYNRGNITGSNVAGGICGSISSFYIDILLLKDTYNTGNVNGEKAGGLIGSYYSSNGTTLVSNCYSAANEIIVDNSGSSGSNPFAGALIGYVTEKSDYELNNCYYLNSGASQAIGNVAGEFGTPKSAANMKKESFVQSLGDAFVYNEGGYPMLFWEAGIPMLSIDKSDLSFNELNQQEKITPDTSYEGELNWISSDEKIATVDENGIVTAIGNGTCIITVEAGGAKASCEVTVAYEYYLKETAITMKPDLAKELKVYSKSNDETTTLEVAFSSSNEDVAEVNKRGLVSANAPGVAEIHAVIGDIDLVCVVTVEGVKGDVNVDGEFTVADVVALQKWLLADPSAKLKNWKAGDFYEDNRLDVFDLCLMKRELLSK